MWGKEEHIRGEREGIETKDEGEGENTDTHTHE